jgi:hypothetical protein
MAQASTADMRDVVGLRRSSLPIVIGLRRSALSLPIVAGVRRWRSSLGVVVLAVAAHVAARCER